MKYKVCLIVDNPLRDLEGMTLIAWHSARKNISCYLVPMYCQAFDIIALKPDVVVVNYIRPNNINLLLRYKKENIKIAVLDTEGSPGKNMEEFAKKISQIKYRNILDLYCVWGNDQYDAFKKSKTFKYDILKITGCPRYDFCAEPHNKTLPKVLNGEKFILINTTFPIGNPKFTKSFEFEEKAMIDMGYEKEFSHQYTKDSVKVCHEMIKIISDVCKTFPDTKFIVRPHPFESSEPYNKLKSYSNFEIYQEGSVTPWLNSCAALLHLNCQTAIEAVMVKKEPISIEWLNTPSLISLGPPGTISNTPKNFNALKVLINLIISNKKLPLNKKVIRSRENLIRSRLLSNDGNSSMRVSVALEKLLKIKINKNKYNKNTIYKSSLKQFLRELFGYSLFHKARRIIQGNKSEFRRSEKKFSNNNVSDIIKRLNILQNNNTLIKTGQIERKELYFPKLFSKETIKITK